MHRGICHAHQWDNTKKHRPSLLVVDTYDYWGGHYAACWRCEWIKPRWSKVKFRLWSTFVAPFVHRKDDEPF